MKNKKYFPFRKPSNDPLYTNAHLNHPKKTIKEIPNMIGKYISEISCDEHEFEKAKGDFNKALEKSGFSEKISAINKVLLNVYKQEKLYGLTLYKGSMSNQM